MSNSANWEFKAQTLHQETWEAKLLRQIENISGILTATAYIIMNTLVK